MKWQSRWSKELLRISNWHPWFAWHPVETDKNMVIWFETVLRKREYYRDGSDWLYKEER